VRSDEPDVTDPIRIVDPDNQSVLVPGDVEDDPPLRTLALAKSLFTSAGEAQSAFRMCRYHANVGSRASA
jgi:hypothetical protein